MEGVSRFKELKVDRQDRLRQFLEDKTAHHLHDLKSIPSKLVWHLLVPHSLTAGRHPLNPSLSGEQTSLDLDHNIMLVLLHKHQSGQLVQELLNLEVSVGSSLL